MMPDRIVWKESFGKEYESGNQIMPFERLFQTALLLYGLLSPATVGLAKYRVNCQ